MHSKKRRLARGLGYQKLESRQLLAAEISEILVRGDGAGLTEQAIELRGMPGAVLSEQTYLVVTDDNQGLQNGVAASAEVDHLFDLGGLSFGDNGYLVLLQHDSPHQADAAANVIQSTRDGFEGLPGAIYSSQSSQQGFSIIGRHSFLLIESNSRPQLGEFLDANIDGELDTAYQTAWNVIDSVSLHWANFAATALGKTVFIGDISGNPAVAAVADDAQVVVVDNADYAALLSPTPSDSPDDWMVGGANINSLLDDDRLRVSLVSVEQPSNRSLSERLLNHFGAPNFYGALTGRLVDQEMNPQTEQLIFLDTNSNGTRDNLAFRHDPEDVLPSDPDTDERYAVTAEFPGLAVTTWRSNDYSDSAFARWDNDASTPPEWVFGDYVFNDAFTEVRKLRIDFHRPVNEVSFKYVGYDGNFFSTEGILEAYDKDGNLLTADRTAALRNNQSETLRVSTGSDEIEYVLAYNASDAETNLGGRFDELSYRQYERQVSTGDDGRFVFSGLNPGSYQLAGEGLFDLPSPITHTVTTSEVQSVEVVVGERPDPVIFPTEFNLDENSLDTLIGTLQTDHLDEASVEFSIEDVDSEFIVESRFGTFFSKQEADLDFESKQVHLVNVRAQDDTGRFAEVELTVTLNDVNDAPQLNDLSFEVLENSTGQIGQLAVSDQDAGQQHVYELAEDALDFPFVITTTGEILVKPLAKLDFEDTSEFTVPVTVTDSGTPAISTAATFTIELLDQNEPPSLATNQFAFNENAIGELLTLTANDEDGDQSHRYELIGGTAVGIVTLSETGQVSVAPDQAIDYESVQTLFMVVRVTDSGQPALASEETVILNIENIDEAPSFSATIDPITVVTGQEFFSDAWFDSIVDPEGHSWTVEVMVDGQETPSWMELGQSEFGFGGIPTSMWIGERNVNVRVASDTNPELFSDLAIELIVEPSDFHFHNSVSAEDVNGDGSVTPVDALQVINYIARSGTGTVDLSMRIDSFPDVLADNRISPVDALRVINYIATQNANPGAESEATPKDFFDRLDRDSDNDEALLSLAQEGMLF